MWRFSGWLLFIASGGDAISTEIALRVPGTYELNWVQRDRWVRVASAAVAPAVVLWSSEKLRRKHRVLAWVLRIGTITAWSYATVHNLRLSRGPP